MDEHEELFLTFAELEALVGTEPGWPAVREAMNTRPPADEQIAVAGFASLYVRELARVGDGGDPEVNADVLNLARRLAHANALIGVTQAVKDQQAILPLIYCADTSGGQRVLTRIAGPGVVGLSAIETDSSIPEHVRALVEALLQTDESAVLIKPVGQDQLTVRRRGDQWELGRPNDVGTSDFQASSREECVHAVTQLVQASLTPSD